MQIKNEHCGRYVAKSMWTGRHCPHAFVYFWSVSLGLRPLASNSGKSYRYKKQLHNILGNSVLPALWQQFVFSTITYGCNAWMSIYFSPCDVLLKEEM